MKSCSIARRAGAPFVMAVLMAAASPAFAGDDGEYFAPCPASMDANGVRNCEIVLNNPDFETRSPGSSNTDLVWSQLPGWAISAPVRIHPIWEGRTYIGKAVGTHGGQSMSQTVNAPVLSAYPGMPLPTYHLEFSASSFGAAIHGGLTARLIGIARQGQESELASVRVAPASSGLEDFSLRASPRGEAPVSLRVEFVRSGGDQPIYVDDVGVALTFDR